MPYTVAVECLRQLCNKPLWMKNGPAIHLSCSWSDIDCIILYWWALWHTWRWQPVLRWACIVEILWPASITYIVLVLWLWSCDVAVQLDWWLLSPTWCDDIRLMTDSVHCTCSLTLTLINIYILSVDYMFRVRVVQIYVSVGTGMCVNA